jgi:hypothetical protein
MNKEFMSKLEYIRTKKDEDGNTGPYFEIGNETKGMVRIFFKGYVDGDILYELMEFAHIDGFFHRGGKTIMELEEKWEEDDF